MQVLEKCLEAAPPGGVIHLALCGDQKGLIMRWKTRLKAYIDPGETFPRKLTAIVNTAGLAVCDAVQVL